MAQHDSHAIHYRSFAFLVMLVTLILGGIFGYMAGLMMGQNQAIELIEYGRQQALASPISTVTVTASPSVSASTVR